MKSKMKGILIILIAVMLLSAAYVCLNLNRIRTIMSLRKVDDYPLFYMRYYGDYKFDFSIPKEFQQSNASGIAPENRSMMCSSFLARNEKGDPIFCRNLDYTLLGHPITLVAANPPGKNASLAMTDLYYLGYNQNRLPNRSLFRTGLMVAPRITIDGVNEYGLAVATLTVPFAKPPYDPKKETTDEAGMSRLILDHASTVDEAVDKINEYNLMFHEGPIHFMIADGSGDSAVVEFLDGQVLVHRDKNDWQVCTNFILSQDLGEKWGLDRYNKAAERLEERNGILSEEEALQLLSDVSQKDTIWSVVYNLRTGETEIVMGKNYTKVNHFDLRMHNE